MTITKNLALSTKRQLIILLFLAFGLNVNTLFNDYAVDDVVVLTGNTVVEKGIKGIPEILTTEFFYGLEKKESDLSGGRYRPFVLVTFALEYQFFGKNPMVSHLINVLLFVLLIALLYVLLQAHIFREQHKQLAFITCLLFIVHPIHTEVIANVKSRDELITFILLIVTSFTFIKYVEKRSIVLLFLGLLCFFLALLTRESAIPLIGLVPLISYFFFNQSIKKSILFSMPLVAVFIVYVAIRISVVGFTNASNTEILNAPFLYATPSEAFATKVFILIKYLWLMIFPYPLSCDYGYNQIPYIDVYSLPFILSSLVLLGLIAYAVFTFNKKSIFSFCILYFIITIFLFANFIIDIGAPLAERLLFQPSLAFCIVLAVLYLQVVNTFKVLAKSTLIAILLLFTAKTISRNHDWKNNETLYFTDVESAPNSIRTNLYAAHQYILKAPSETNKEQRDEYFKKAVYYDERILKIYPHYRYIYEDLGLAYFGLLDYFKAADPWVQAYKLAPSDSTMKKRIEMLSDVLFNEGNKFYKIGTTDAAIRCYKKSVELNDNNVDAWYNLTRSYFLIKDIKNENDAWQNVLRLSPKTCKLF